MAVKTGTDGSESSRSSTSRVTRVVPEPRLLGTPAARGDSSAPVALARPAPVTRRHHHDP